MSNKTEKKLRRVARKEYLDKALDLQQRAVDNWIYNLLKKPLKVRLRVAWNIIKGAGKCQTKKQ